MLKRVPPSRLLLIRRGDLETEIKVDEYGADLSVFFCNVHGFVVGVRLLIRLVKRDFIVDGYVVAPLGLADAGMGKRVTFVYFVF